jgi:hypothetical protein
LRSLPVANTRTCADSFGGTSKTTSPSWTKRRARCLPIPLQPSTAQIRSANVRATASIPAYPAVSVPYLPAASTTARSSMASIVAERLCGSIPMITPRGILLRLPRRGTATLKFYEGRDILRLPGTSLARRALLLRAGQTPFEPPLRGAGREAGQMSATPMTTAGSRNVGASRRTPGPSLAGPDPAPKSLSSRDDALHVIRHGCAHQAAPAANGRQGRARAASWEDHARSRPRASRLTGSPGRYVR